METLTFQNEVKNATDLEQIDELCWKWFEDLSVDFGSDGDKARKLLEVAKYLMQ